MKNRRQMAVTMHGLMSTKTNQPMLYSTDLTDGQWEVIKQFVNAERQRRHSLRGIWNAIRYLVKTGCHWRLLPNDFAPWSVVYYYFRRWKRSGVYEVVLNELNLQQRKTAKRRPAVTACIIDSQSVKTTMACQERGYDAGKKTKGHKRHLAVDTQGNLLALCVHSASVQDRDGAVSLLAQAQHAFSSIRAAFADGGYSGKLVDLVKELLGIKLKIVKKEPGAFKVLHKRWIVERTFAWINNCRRNAKDVERKTESSEAMCRLALIHVGLNRITH
jgi:putative transposase